jgi:hypothetical protein
MEEEIEKKHRLKMVIWADFGFRQFANTKRPLNSPDDFKGLKLRAMPLPPLADMVNALVASAVPIGWSEAIPAVQQGVVDGLDLPVVNLITINYSAASGEVFDRKLFSFRRKQLGTDPEEIRIKGLPDRASRPLLV